MELNDAKNILPLLSKYIGFEAKPKGLKIKKFLIVPFYAAEITAYLNAYNANHWNEEGLLKTADNKKEYNIIAQYDLEYPNMEYTSMIEFLKANQIALE